MRDLIDRLDHIITESVGLANRKPGDRWANPEGDEIAFSDLTFYPQRGQYEDAAQLQQAIDQVTKSLGIRADNLAWSNDSRGAQAFGIAHFVDDANQDYYIGRWFRRIDPIRSKNNFPNDLPGGFKLQTKAAKKEATGYKPSEVLTQLDNLTPQDIAAQIRAKFGEGSDEDQAVTLFMQAKSYPIMIPLGGMNFEAFTNYFCEMLQPMALVLGKSVTGAASKAESKFLTQGGYTTCGITFNAGVSGGLFDSFLTNPAGQTMGLSSKAKNGAKASAKNLVEKIEEMEQDADGRRLLSKYRKTVDIMRAVTEGSTPGSLNTAVMAGIISEKERDQILALRNMSEGEDPVGTGRLTKRLEQMYRERKSRDPAATVPFFHLRAAVAIRVADWVNNNTDFSKVAAEILNWGAFIQVYTKASQSGNNIRLEPFNVIYPSEAVTGVLLSADKTFYSTQGKGNFTFKLLLNNASAKDVELDMIQTDTKPDVEVDQDFEVPQARVKASAGGVEKPLGSEKSLGRQRRR
jgi:hypothetical protein